MRFSKELVHKKMHHNIFYVIQPAFLYLNEHIKDRRILSLAINHLKTRGNALRNRAVDEYEFYEKESSEALFVYLRGIISFTADLAYREAYTALKLRTENWEELAKQLKSDLDVRLSECLELLKEEIK